MNALGKTCRKLKPTCKFLQLIYYFKHIALTNQISRPPSSNFIINRRCVRTTSLLGMFLCTCSFSEDMRALLVMEIVTKPEQKVSRKYIFSLRIHLAISEQLWIMFFSTKIPWDSSVSTIFPSWYHKTCMSWSIYEAIHWKGRLSPSKTTWRWDGVI